MGNHITEGIITIFSLIIGIAALSVLLSPKATTSQVIQSTASGFSNSLATAMTPVTGEHVSIDTSYPQQGNGYGFGGGGLPTLGLGPEMGMGSFPTLN